MQEPRRRRPQPARHASRAAALMKQCIARQISPSPPRTPSSAILHRPCFPSSAAPLHCPQAAAPPAMQRAGQSILQSLRLRVSSLVQQEAASACRWLSSAATEAASSAAPEGVSILPRHQALKRALKPQASWPPPPPPPPPPCLVAAALVLRIWLSDTTWPRHRCLQNSGRNAFRRNWAKQLQLKVCGALRHLQEKHAAAAPSMPCLRCCCCTRMPPTSSGRLPLCFCLLLRSWMLLVSPLPAVACPGARSAAGGGTAAQARAAAGNLQAAGSMGGGGRGAVRSGVGNAGCL